MNITLYLARYKFRNKYRQWQRVQIALNFTLLTKIGIDFNYFILPCCMYVFSLKYICIRHYRKESVESVVAKNVEFRADRPYSQGTKFSVT